MSLSKHNIYSKTCTDLTGCVIWRLTPGRVQRVCGTCGSEFAAFRYQVSRGKARFCSKRCAARGTANPNWKHGRAAEYSVYKDRFRAKFPEKNAAHDAVQSALYRGALTRPSCCSACGGVGQPPSAHHDDYSQPLAVRWLCRPCHRIADRVRRSAEVS